MAVFLSQNDTSAPPCSLTVYSKVFWKGCLPGSQGALCKVCVGGKEEPGTKRCTDNHNERYYGNMGTLRYVAEKMLLSRWMYESYLGSMKYQMGLYCNTIYRQIPSFLQSTAYSGILYIHSISTETVNKTRSTHEGERKRRTIANK